MERDKLSIAVVLGTRPEIIKMAPIIRECDRRGLDYVVIHTGQHYSYEMDKVFFEDLELPQPTHNLDVGSGSHADQTGLIMSGTEKILIRDTPAVVLVQGDTNTALGATLAASKLHIKIGHIEAGLRSFDRNMPEEINRIVTDHVSEYLFAPTELAKNNLCREGISECKIYVTGNTIVDSIYQSKKIAEHKAQALNRLSLKTKEYFLVTVHRAENVNNSDRLKQIITGLQIVNEDFNLPVIFPVHPRTKKMLQKLGLKLNGIRTIEPVGFLDFLQLEANARLILTDSGGVQEETCILGVPCVTLRDSTERPETLEAKSNILAGSNSAGIIGGVRYMLKLGNSWKNPFGDGKSASYILDLLHEGA